MAGCGHEHEHEHEGGHGGGHGHEGHAHDHTAMAARAGGRRRLAIALAVTASFMVAEAVGGVLSNSRALVADAGHMLSDAGSLALALLAGWFATRPATRHKSYGWLRLEILAALANGAALVAIGALIAWEAVERALAPEPVDVPLMLGVATLGLLANLASAWVLHGDAHGHGGGEGHLNVRAAYAHVLSDLIGSVGAIIAGLVMWRTQAWVVDPVVAGLVSLLVLRSGWRVVRQAADILLEGVPAHVDLDALARTLREVDGVASVHDVHVWTISSGVHLMTGHVVTGRHGDHHDLLVRLSQLVRERFGIARSTIQLECTDGAPCEGSPK